MQNSRVPMADCQQETFTSGEFNEMEKSLIQGRRLHDFPASQPIKYFNSLEYTVSARKHLSNQARQIARDC